jgi:hypothetical protein
MQIASKLYAFFFALLVLFVGTSLNTYEVTLLSVKNSGNIESGFYKSKKDHSFLTQTNQQNVQPSASNKVTFSREHVQSKKSKGSVFHLEVKLLTKNAQYLQHSSNITAGLNLKTIIFPFHYFW